jgi:hypothetical protein
LHDLIRANLPVLYDKVSRQISQEVQGFLKNTLEEAHVRAKHLKEAIRTVFDTLRAATVRWSSDETSEITAKKASDLKKHHSAHFASSSSHQLVQLVRIQMQHLMNPESQFMQAPSKVKRVAKSLHEQDQVHLFEFISESATYLNLLSLEDTLTLAGDQSCFYFKEVRLDLNGVVQFPVRSSIPFLLCQYALDNYVQPELTEILFYPLAIYNDAALSAVNHHKSSMLFNEIRAESEVCLATLSVLIGEFTFNAFRTFATLRQLPERMATRLKQTHRWPLSKAYRLRSLLAQSQFFLLSKQVALPALIAPRVDSELNSAVAKLFEVGKDLGVIASLAIDHALSIIRETHRMLVADGLPMMSFSDIERAAKQDNVVGSHCSTFFTATLQHLFKVVARRYALNLDPLRLMPPKRVQLPADPLGKLSLGRILKEALESTVSFASLSHFSAWINHFGDGGLATVADRLREYTAKSVEHFLEQYHQVSSRLVRINDPPFGAPTRVAFTRFEGAYHFFLEDKPVLSLLRAMQAIGNALGIAALLDQAVALRATDAAQLLGYIRGVNAEGGPPRDEFIRLFDATFAESAKVLASRTLSLHEDVDRVFLSAAVGVFTKMFTAEIEAFTEPQVMSPDFTVMVGFPAVWTVLDFVYSMIEGSRMHEDECGFAQFGFGVMLCAALILLETKQLKLAKILSIGNRMKAHWLTDVTGMVEDKVVKYIGAAEASGRALDAGAVLLEPIVAAQLN